MDAMREEIPSLVAIPVRSYGRIYAIGVLLVMTTLWCGGLIVLLESGSMKGLRPLEPSERIVGEIKGELAKLNDCRGHLAQAEKALAQREAAVASVRAPIQTLDALQRELPQDAWIHSLRVTQGRVELVLNTMSEEVSVGLVDRLTRSSRIFHAHVQSIERSQTNGDALFVIRLTASIGG